jgi:A/G-specific adenine glycosylase
MGVSKRKLSVFVSVVREFALRNTRELPWRETYDPYLILVSEIMLQQTQVDRVVPKYMAFVKKFPNFKKLAGAGQDGVLSLWKGLGYNRRALALHRLAKVVCEQYKGRLPDNEVLLRLLPGVGSYTARAVLAFAFNKPVVFIETNIRTVYIHHFFPDRTAVDDKELLPIIELTLDHSDPRQWYYALMDYGSVLKKTVGNLNVRSKHYAKQSKFQGSDRQIRGKILEFLLARGSFDRVVLFGLFAADDPVRVLGIMSGLVSEGFVDCVRGVYSLRS